MKWHTKLKSKPRRSRSNQSRRPHLTPNTSRQYRRHSAFKRQPSETNVPNVGGIEFPLAKVKRAAAGIAIVIFIGWLGLFGWLRETPHITGDTTSRLVMATENYLDQVTNFRLSLSQKSLQDYLLGVLPEYRSIIVTIPLLDNTIIVDSELHDPAFIWQANGRQYAITPSGVVIDELAQAPSELLTIIDNASLDYSTGDHVATQEFLSFITQLDRVLQQSEFTASSLRIDGSTQQVVVTLDEQPYQLRLSPAITPASQIATVEDVLTQLNEAGQGKPTSYIDTRIAGRAFWQ